MTKFKSILLLGTAICVSLLSSIGIASSNQAGSKKVELTFAFFGCNRIDQKDYEEDVANNPSSANVPQLKQNLTDIAALKAGTVFFGGDIVMGYADDKGETLKTQTDAWVKVIKSAPKYAGSKYIVISGNHELNRKHKDQKVSNPATDPVWTKFVSENKFIPAVHSGPTAASSPGDDLVGDQSALSFSYDQGSVHFVVLNTDTRVTKIDKETGKTKIGMIPVNWLNSDLDAAEKNTNIKQVIVMGHRNVIDPLTSKGDAPIDETCSGPMIKSLESHHKVRAYICAHVHAFDIAPIGSMGLLQVCFGNGGSKLEKGWKPKEGRSFGFGYFKAYADGSLGVVPHLRPEPKNYMETDKAQVPPAVASPELIIPVR